MDNQFNNIELEKDRIVCQGRGISKRFFGVTALNAIDFDIKKGEIHGLVGKNGAGKSTLVNILSGFIPFTQGEILINGIKVPKNYNPGMAEKLRIYFIPQSPFILPQRSVTENLFAGYTLKKKNGLVDDTKMREITEDIIKKSGFYFSPDQEMQTLPIDTQKFLLLGKGIYITNADIFMFDEITAALNIEKRDYLFNLVKKLKAAGKSIIFISHYLKEIIRYCDRVTVLRDGNKITTDDISNVTEEELSKLVIGKDIVEYSLTADTSVMHKNLKILLSVKDLMTLGDYDSINFDLYNHEVLGFAGLEGCGKDEIFTSLIGLKHDSGKIMIDGREVVMNSPNSAIKQSVVYLPQEKEKEAILHGLSIEENIMQSTYQNLTSDRSDSLSMVI